MPVTKMISIGAWFLVCVLLMWFCSYHFTKHDRFPDKKQKEATRHLRYAFLSGLIFFLVVVSGLIAILLTFKH